jgi:hypothetical protein
MSLAIAIRRLSGKRRLVTIVLILSCLVGVVISFRIPAMTPRQYHVGIASASALVDSARSQVADLGGSTGTDVGTLAERASLLASLMTTAPIKNEIAERAGVAPNNLIATGPATVVSADSPAPSVPNAPIAASSPNASTLSTSVPTLPAGQIPVIQINTQAPSAEVAAKLANGAITALQAEIKSVAGSDGVPSLQQVVIRPLGNANVATAAKGPGPIMGALGALLVFVLGCGAILGFSSVSEALRADSLEYGHDHEDPETALLRDAAAPHPVVAPESFGTDASTEDWLGAYVLGDPPESIAIGAEQDALTEDAGPSRRRMASS